MVSASLVLVSALHLSEGPGADAAELRARAEGKAKDRAYADAGEVYVTLADLPEVDRVREMFNAHTNFEAAFLTSRQSRHLCRALGIAELVVREDRFKDEDMGLFWRELVDQDLERLREDAIKTRRPNCRFAASGGPRPSVPLLADGEPPAVRMPVLEIPEPARDIAPAVPSRRYRAQTAAGAVFTGLGVGFIGLFAGALAVKADQVQAIRKQADLVKAQDRMPTPAEQGWVTDREANARQMQSLLVGVGVAGGASLATGVILLATRRRLTRRAAMRPYGDAQGAGILLHGRF